MKIVHISSAFNPGFGYELNTLPVKQARLGHEVAIVAGDKKPSIAGVDSLELEYNKKGFFEYNGIDVYRLDTVFRFHGMIIVKGLKKILASIKPDIVYAHEPMQVDTAQPAMHKDLGYKLVIDQHNYSLPFTLIGKAGYLLIKRQICNYAFKKADAIIANTPRAKEFLISIHGLREKDITFIPLGADDDVFKFDSEKRRKLRALLDIDNSIVLISPGQINRHKRLDKLLEVFARLCDKHDLRLLLVGSADATITYLKQSALTLKISDKVKFISRVSQEELAGYLSASDIAVWPHRTSITIPEAMACGLPICLPDMASMSHYAKYNNGLLFPFKDYKEMQVALEKLIIDENLRREMSSNSRKAVDEVFSYDVIAKKHIDLYRSLL